MHYCFTSCAQIVLCPVVVYFVLALYFYHQLCLLARQNAITILSVWTLSHCQTLTELNALPRNSLILLASARNLVTTGTKRHLAQRVYEHKCANTH